jgi:hypothetical protein
MATGNIRNSTLSSKKSSSTSKKSTRSLIANSPSTEAQFRELLMNISSAERSEEPEFPEPWIGEGYGEESWGNHFVWGSTQINTDLAQAAQCEFEDDIFIDGLDCNIFDFGRSPMFWKLRQQFVKDAAAGDTHAFIYLVWRCYSAGRLSPNRLSPRTPEQRRSHRMMLHAAQLEARAEGLERHIAGRTSTPSVRASRSRS